jgi:penicillin G amidase
MTYTFKDPLKDKLLSILICTLIVLNWACDDAGEVSAGEVSAGEVSAGEVSAGEVSAGEVSAGEVSAGEMNPLSMLTDQVKVQFDEVGGLHLTCKTATDCFTAQGYYHAAHRFTQMDINRLFPQGRLGERIGNLALDIDRRNRLLFSTKDGQSIEEQMWAACSAESRAMLEAYTIGVNAWIAKWRAGDPEAKLSEEYDFSIFDKSTIRDWTPLDSLSVAMVLIQDLTERSGAHLRNARLLSHFGPDIYFDVYGEAPAFPTAILNGSEGVDASASPISTSKDKELDQSILREGYHQIYQRLRTYNAMFNADEWESYSAWRRLPERTNHPIGSNNWVVAPSRSSTDHAWLSNDPHLGLSNPSVWYLAHLKVESESGNASTDFNVTGVTLPGIPSIIIGHNEHIAWGMTTTYFDFTDLYIEELSEDGEHVIFNGEEVPIYHREDRFDFAGLPTEQHESLYVPHHGPIISIDREAGTAISMRWTGQDADTDVNFLLGLARSNTVGEAKEAIKNVTTIGQNFVIADDQGEIAWFPYNRLPSRPWVSASLNPAFPLPGDGQAEWGMPIPYESLPQLLNPELGIIVTANHDMTGALSDGDATNDAQEPGVAQAMQERPAFGYRYSQSMRLVDREMPHDRQSLTDAIHDRELLVGRRLLPALITAVDISMLSESGQRVLGVLSRWGEGARGYDCPAGLSLDTVDQSTPSNDPQEIEDSAACYAFHVLYSELGKHIFRDELIEMGGDQNITPDYEATARLIARPELLMGGVSYWDDVSTEITEDPSLIIAEAMNATGSYFNREYGVNTEDWLWGKVHTVTMNASILNEAGVRDFNNGPYPNHGGLYTVDVANPRNLFTRQYDHSAGASMRFVCELSSPPICQIEVPGGQRHHRDSPYYDDLLHKWLDRDPILLPFEAADVETRSVESFDWPLSDQ